MTTHILKQRRWYSWTLLENCTRLFNTQLWRACNLTSFSPCLTGPVDYLFTSRHKGPRFKSPGRYFCETGILLLALSRYIGDPDVIDHHGLVWGGLRPEPSLGPSADNVTIPLDLTQLSCPGFTLAAGLPSGFTTDRVSCWGGALWRACNLTSFSPCLTGPVDYLFASRHKGPRQIPRGVIMWNRDSPVSVVSLHSVAVAWICDYTIVLTSSSSSSTISLLQHPPDNE